MSNLTTNKTTGSGTFPPPLFEFVSYIGVYAFVIVDVSTGTAGVNGCGAILAPMFCWVTAG
jgi:hypothetical protein